MTRNNVCVIHSHLQRFEDTRISQVEKHLGDMMFEVHADFCTVLSNPKRLKIMWLIGDGEKSVHEIAHETGMSESAVSQHLRVMKDRGAIVSRKDGRTVYIRVANKNFLKGLRSIRKGLIEEQEKKSKTMKAQD